MKIDEFDFFYNKHKGKKCLILGGAPSIKDIDYKNFDGIIIAMGDVPIRLKGECNVDYWITASNVFPKPDVDYDVINQFKNTTFLFSHSAAFKIDYSVLKTKLKLPWFEYDQRHFSGRPCNKQIDYRFDFEHKLDCCEYIGKTTIQEYLQEKYKTTDHYSTASTVAIHGLALAIILGCEDIYIAGVDLPLNQKDYNYFGNDSLLKLLRGTGPKKGIIKYNIKQFFIVLFKINRKSVFYDDMPTILKDFEYLTNICISNDINLYNLSKNSSLNKIHGLIYLAPCHLKLHGNPIDK